MTTQGFIKIRESKDYGYYDKLIWLYHDAYPENFEEILSEIDFKGVKLTSKNVYYKILNKLSEIGYGGKGDYGIYNTKELNQNMEYKYVLDLYNDEYQIPKLYLKIEEEKFIDDEFEGLKVITADGLNYLDSEMRTKKVIQLI